MRKTMKVLPIILIMVILSGCGVADTSNKGSNPIVKKQTGSNKDDKVGDKVHFKGEILQNKERLLVAPDPKSNEFKSSDKMSVGLTDAVVTNMQGKKMKVEDLKTGDIIEITYNGVIMESYPAQIGAFSVKLVGHNKITDGYLAMIDDIYQEDSGLNGNIKMIAVDTSGWTGLEANAKKIVLERMNLKYNLDIKEGTMDELSAQGIIDKKNLIFKDGILITISHMQLSKDNDEISYSISKWRSGTGAIGSDNARAKWNGKAWDIKKGDVWIS